eukprot:4841801-Prymnesium_polylepis.1
MAKRTSSCDRDHAQAPRVHRPRDQEGQEVQGGEEERADRARPPAAARVTRRARGAGDGRARRDGHGAHRRQEGRAGPRQDARRRQ